MNSIPVSHINVSYPTDPISEVLSPDSGKTLRLFSIRLSNNSGGTSNLGVIRSLASAGIKVFTYDGVTAVDVTSSIIAGTAINFCTSSAGTGLLLQASKKIGYVGINCSTSGTGSPTYAITYFNGSSFVSNSAVFSAFPSPITSGNRYMVIGAGSSWEVGSNIAGLDADKYTLRIAVTSSSNSPQINSIVLGEVIDLAYTVPNLSSFECNFSQDYPLHLDALEGIIPYFSDSDSLNMVTAYYSQDN